MLWHMTRSIVTFTATDHHCPLASTKLYYRGTCALTKCSELIDGSLSCNFLTMNLMPHHATKTKCVTAKVNNLNLEILIDEFKFKTKETKTTCSHLMPCSNNCGLFHFYFQIIQIQQSLSYIVWNFHLNWLTFLKAMQQNKMVHFTCVHIVPSFTYNAAKGV